VRLSVRSKFALAFGGLLVLTALVAVFGLRGLSSVNDKTQTISDVDVPSLTTIADVVLQQNTVRRYTSQLVLSKRPEDVKTYLGKLDASTKQVQADLSKYRTTLVTSAADRAPLGRPVHLGRLPRRRRTHPAAGQGREHRPGRGTAGLPEVA
jgi:hypothetical protein